MAKPITISDDEMIAMLDEQLRNGWMITSVVSVEAGRFSEHEIQLVSAEGVTDSIQVNSKVAGHAKGLLFSQN